MRPSIGKKVKQDDSDNKFREKVYRSMYPSPCSSYDPNKWLQNNDISWLSHSLEQDIDKILQIAAPQPLKPQNNRRASANDIREEFDDKIGKQKRNTWYVDKQHDEQPKNSKLKINMSSIICEFPIQKVSRQSISDQPKTPNCQKSFMEAIISRYQQQNEQQEDQFEKEKKFLFQSDKEFQSDKKLFQSDKKQQILEPEIHVNEIDDNILNEEQQNTSLNEENPNKQKKQKPTKGRKVGRKKKSIMPAPKRKTRQTKKQERIQQLPEPAQTELYQEKTKYIRPATTIDHPIFNTNQCWARMQFRKEAKKYEKYQTQEFQDLLHSLPGCYIHKCEGDLRIDKIRPMQNAKGKFFQSFEMWINPLVLIGPIKMNNSVKLHVRFKKGYSGQVYCDSALQETLPLNQVDGKTFHKQKLMLANNSDHVIKLVCCLVNISIRGPSKRCK
ncbi:unnamed protein product (macronuclear) [Paramecium tetraurelia]|uniref:Uncharacterized protein n=1 Tax=Paramecium tetraurelia TaxID=5888 RepID=A0D8X8_PARTE|nr:uncharacterized protein GSPATT00014441001 [Paramecium tetraurelia]CAK79495.1 unnamed protein product [Paramecium tetraurelia]|eukprot:XP_001446892.1 hypothetical protein (macronuclear) [Paramecium tetraurelia strain d4-2]